MPDETVDRSKQGWGLKLDDSAAVEVLKCILRDSTTENEVRQKCTFAFNGPMIFLTWREEKKDVYLSCDGRRNIFAAT